MGGTGSGDWYRFDKKSTVEESLTLAVRDVRSRKTSHLGQIVWTGSAISYRVTWDNEPTITLLYRLWDSEDVEIPIRLQTTPTQFGGKRWWFTCPLIVRGVACNRRVGKVYLPPEARYFGCRKCHDLSYQSCQEAHQLERLLDRLKARLRF